MTRRNSTLTPFTRHLVSVIGKKSPGIFFLVLLLPGCFLSQTTTERALDPAVLRTLAPGQTTATEVAESLGAPSRVVEIGKRSAWLYEHLREKQEGVFLLLLGLYGKDTQADRVWVFFDERGVLTHYASSFQAQEAEYDVPLF